MRREKKSLKTKILDYLSRNYFLVATLVFVICVAVVALVVFKIAEVRDEKAREQEKQAHTGEELSPDGRDYALEVDAYPEIKEVMVEYHNALADYNEETIKKYLMYVNQNDLDLIEIKSEYIEKYDNIVCYTQKAEAEGAYYVYVSYTLKLDNFAHKMPGVIGFYYCPDEEGNPKICRQTDISEDVLTDFYVAYSKQDVQDLYNQVTHDYNEVLDADEQLKTYMAGFDEMVNREMVKRVALREATEEHSEVPSEETTEPEENTTYLVEPTTTVNVRGSASEKGEVKGQVGPGTQLTCVEEMINGWTHVIYNGADGYIRSDYLKKVGEGDSNTVTVKESVNIREQASMDSKVIALAQAGTQLELIERLDGWCKVKYNGQTAYVKSEYVQ
ncbi:MAG: SH3 domain-containing protein [Lachnospiraceae bacterium]|nr:SH3 domain-containing protein [Lachnospiraceae bacterium]